jgi:aminopeptidase-like protein
VSITLTPRAAATNIGDEAYELMERLFPYCRSLTGAGVRGTFEVLEQEIPITRTEIPSGTRAFDWIVPDEWNLREAYIVAPDGSRVVDLRDSTLHVVSYSEPVRATLPLDALRERLHTLPEQPDVVPYRTSYYERTWGFCLSHRQLLELQPGDYQVVIDSTLEPGHLSYAEHRIQGEGPGEVLLSTYVCHPSLANDNLSGIAVATMLARRLLGRRLRHTYRFLFAPGTIGPLAWLHQNRNGLDRVEHGLTLSCIGDEGNLTYKRSRVGDAEVDRAMETVLRDSGAPHRLLPWEPWGGDERQFCSPGFDLPVGTLMRTPHGEFSGYHTSADGLERIRPEALGEAVDTCLELVGVLESNRRPLNLSPFGEPQLGRRGLYRSAGGAVATPDDERALLWVLNQGDGHSTLLDVALSSGLSYAVVRRAAERLEAAGLVAAIDERSGHSRSRSEIRRSSAGGQSMPSAGSSQRTPRAASGT